MLCVLLSSKVESADSELSLGKFSNNDLTGWKVQSIGLMKPKTIYNFIKDNDKTVLSAHSIKSASGLIYNLNLDPKEYPTLKWSWKIDHIIKKGDEKLKDGDDFSVRVYVLFPRGFFSKTRAICYVWANKLPKREHVVSPFTPNIITVAVDSGDELAGRWTLHQRNIYEDYRLLFGEEPPKIGAVALMTDTDNTGESTNGYYGDISLIHSPKVHEHKHKEPQSKDLKLKEQPLKEPVNNHDKPLPPTNLPKTVPKNDTLKQKPTNDKERPESSITTLPPPDPQRIINP